MPLRQGDGRLRFRHEGPSARRVTWTFESGASLTAATFRIEQGAKVIETVCSYKSRRRQLPQGVFRLARQLSCSLGEIRKEGSATTLERVRHSLSWMRYAISLKVRWQ